MAVHVWNDVNLFEYSPHIPTRTVTQFVSPCAEILSEVVLNKPSWGITLSTKNRRSVIKQNKILLAFQGSDQLLESYYCWLVGAMKITPMINQGEY